MKQIENVEIYGLEQSIRASKFPMAVDINKCTSDIKPMTKQLGRVATGTGHEHRTCRSERSGSARRYRKQR